MKKKILIVEDEMKVSKAYHDHLERGGFEIAVAHDGEEGLRMAHNLMPDLILLDVMMPVMDGLTMLKIIKADKSLSHIPVIMLSNLDTAESVATAVSAGSTNYLIKSNYSLSELDAKVHTVLNI